MQVAHRRITARETSVGSVEVKTGQGNIALVETRTRALEIAHAIIKLHALRSVKVGQLYKYDGYTYMVKEIHADSFTLVSQEGFCVSSSEFMDHYELVS